MEEKGDSEDKSHIDKQSLPIRQMMTTTEMKDHLNYVNHPQELKAKERSSKSTAT